MERVSAQCCLHSVPYAIIASIQVDLMRTVQTFGTARLQCMIHLLRLRVNTTRPLISSIWCYHSRGLEYYSSGDIDVRQPSVYMTVGLRPILLLLLMAGSLPTGLYAAALLLYT